jgi:hypothetical protein
VGLWGIPESEVGSLPELAGRDALELGCGTGYVSAWRAPPPAGASATYDFVTVEWARRWPSEGVWKARKV